MIDARLGGFRDRRLGAESNAKPGAVEHGEIVGPVAHGEGFLKRNLMGAGEPQKRVLFRRPAEHRRRHPAGDRAVFDQQFVGLAGLKPDGFRHPVREEMKTAGNERGDRAHGVHGRHQRARAGRYGDAFFEDFFQRRGGQSLKHGDARAERAFKLKLTAHRPFGDGGDFRAFAGDVGKLVDAFLFDDGRIHVGDQQALAAVFRRQDVDIHGNVLARAVCGEQHAFIGFFHGDVVGDARRQLAQNVMGKKLFKTRDAIAVDDRLGGIGDHGQDIGHSSTEDLVRESQIIFIAGPTASGKSAAALALASLRDGEIINADAMQIYRDLRIITARPTPEDESCAPHRLYGVLDGAEACSAGRWARMAADAVRQALARGKAAILVGGAGLYFKALEDGLSPIPDIPGEIRGKAKARRAAIGAAGFRAETLARDPKMAHLPEGDSQRLMRAWEVFEATGKPLSHFQGLPREPLIEGDAQKALIAPPRETLYANCDARAAQMFETGALEEVDALLARGLDPALPIMKTLGVPEIASFLRGERGREDALLALQQNTRRFSKRQMTWFRRQTTDWPRFESPKEAVAALSP